MNSIVFKKTTSPAVFDPGFSAGRWANAEVGTRDEVPWRSQFPSPSPKKEETSAQGSREESRGSVIQLFSGTMPGNLSQQRRIGQGNCSEAGSIVSPTIVGTTII